MKEIRLHGIGGLGTVKAGEMLVHAAVASGKYGNSIPFFGFERQGAPVTSYVGTIFIVAGRKRPGHAVGIGGVNQAITKAIAPRLMLAGITIKIFPQHRRKNKFRIDRRLQ